jgi:hypothetical protein
MRADPKLKKAWNEQIARVRGFNKRGSEDWDAECASQ